MARYKVGTKCHGCGRFYKTQAKPNKKAPASCKHCGSRRTKARFYQRA